VVLHHLSALCLDVDVLVQQQLHHLDTASRVRRLQRLAEVSALCINDDVLRKQLLQHLHVAIVTLPMNMSSSRSSVETPSVFGWNV